MRYPDSGSIEINRTVLWTLAHCVNGTRPVECILCPSHSLILVITTEMPCLLPCFHDARPVTGGDDIVARMSVRLERAAALGGDVAEFARLIVPEGLPPRTGLAHARRAEDDDGRPNAPVKQRLLGLGVFE